MFFCSVTRLHCSDVNLKFESKKDYTENTFSRTGPRSNVNVVMAKSSENVGGGVKKILYALQTLRQIGITRASKALNSKNACKACGLGMGGQNGGMTDEQGAFPSICNKSVQAQSTDIQPAIPEELFEYRIDDFRELSPHDIEHIGRLNSPIFKRKGREKFEVVTWGWALKHAASQFLSSKPERAFFYSSGRSSNEAGFVLQLFARVFGSNNVNNCSYYCHQATGVGLGNSIGSGTATVTLDDLDAVDLMFVIGANPASNHPRFIYKLKGCRDRGGHVVVINPAKEPGLVKFAVPKSPKSILAGGSEIASDYLQPNIGSDWFLLQGLAKAVVEKNGVDEEFVDQHTQNYSSLSQSLASLSWGVIIQATGLSQAQIEKVAEIYCRAKNVVFAWGMGITHHTNGVENVEAISNLALLRGMIGRPNAGLLPLRGHSNVQGVGTVGVKPKLPENILNNMSLALKIPETDMALSEGLDTLACLEQAYAGEMEAALIMGGNLYQATPNTKWAEQALDAVPFKCYLTTTLNYGHIHGCDNSDVLILPVCARDEEPQATTQESMFNFVRLSDGGISRLDNVRSEVHVLSELAHNVVGDSKFNFLAFTSFQSVREAIAKTVPNMQPIEHIEATKGEFHINNRIIHSLPFSTPSGKAKFCVHSDMLRQTEANKELQQEFPFTLASLRSEGQFNSIIYETKDTYRGTKSRWVIMANAKDIAALGKRAGDPVTVTSQHGEMKNVELYAYEVPRGNVLAYYPEANVLIGLERDPKSQTPAFKSVRVSLK